jgi:cupin superfamily acireductone dioxygenase involved in methionine salvage
MRTFLAVCGSILAFSTVSAQQPTQLPDLKSVATSTDVAAIVERLKSQPAQPLRTSPLLQLPPYNANIEYRTAVATAAIHDTEAELFYVIDGSGTFVIGGQLVDAQRTNAENSTGKSVTGGMSRKVSKGDVMLVPQGTVHWFSAIDGSITLMSMHLPRK